MNNNKADKLTVLDIYCGAGGFSEGFRQQGFDIVMGIDKWEPAVQTFNHNFGLDCCIKNVLDFKDSIGEIELLPDTDVIIGSPPCVTFSSSNISGKADKTSGINLTKIFLRIVAVKKWKKNSKLKAWFMENVPSSRTHLSSQYTFEELNLTEWAAERRIGKSKIAIKLKGNQPLINSAYYGTPQVRKRVVSGEIISKKKMVIPPTTHKSPSSNKELPSFNTLGFIKNNLPSPNAYKSEKTIVDPLYPNIRIKMSDLTDHFYDTGLFECEWRQSKFYKTNHPYMGKMSFPENETKPSRTVVAMNTGISREAIIYKSEYDRKGDGEYRIPTIRESACLMSFPITYQFLGSSEGIKRTLVGNAVCPSVSRAFAKELRRVLRLPKIDLPIVEMKPRLSNVINLNSPGPKEFNTPSRRNKGSRCRRHPFKEGNMTVTLSNYDIGKNEKEVGEWITSIQYGRGEGFPTSNFDDDIYREIESIICKFKKGKKFLKVFNNGFTNKIGNKNLLQELYEARQSKEGLLEPTELVDKIKVMIEDLNVEGKFHQNGNEVLPHKETVPLKQLFALYAISRVCYIANNSSEIH